MTNPDSSQGRGEHVLSRPLCWLGFAVIVLVFIAGAALTWRKWPDVLVDFGTQLYIPWRIINGAVLYRDLFYFAGGPFSQYFNALLFKLFGVSFSTLIAANLVLALSLVLVLYRQFCAAADVWTGTLIGLGIVMVFTFGQYIYVGNYNFVAPYSHEATHGIILSIFAMAGLSGWLKKGKTGLAVAAGFCLGFVFLTKPDIFMALAVATLAAFVIFGIKRGARQMAGMLGVFIIAAIIPLLGFLFLFLQKENLPESLRALVFGWLPLFQPGITSNPFYKWCMGFDQPWANLREIAVSSVLVVAAVAVYAFALGQGLNLSSRFIKSPSVMLFAFISPLLFWAFCYDWRGCGWALPLLTASACVLNIWYFRQRPEAPVFPLLLSLFSLVLLAKTGLFPRIFHYGFALGMPAFVSSVYLLFYVLPLWLEAKFKVSAQKFRIAAGLVLLIGFSNLFNSTRQLVARKTTPIGSGGDTILTWSSTINPALPSSEIINSSLAWTEQNVPPGATVAVVPEGIMLNFLSRHVNPTPCLFWDPNSLTMFGQSNMVADFEKNPPDYILIVDRNSREFGFGYFGSSPDFGQGLMQWIQDHYQTQILFGSEPLQSGLFGIKIMKRTSPAPPSPPVSSALPLSTPDSQMKLTAGGNGTL